jgi:U3 small nucleolar RNA-associated protein 12
MVKSYLRYSQGACLGVIASGSSNVQFDSTGELGIAPALAEVRVWNLRTGAIVQKLSDKNLRAEVTSLCMSPDGQHVAAGYSDGSVRIWDLGTAQCEAIFQGHKKAVSALRYNATGSLLASGGKDTDIVVWDVVAEAGQCRLRGHKDAVTDLVFLERGPFPLILSCSKDTLAKVWEVESKHCVQTLVGHRNELWSVDTDRSETRVVTAGKDTELRVWSWGPATGDGTGPRELICLGVLQRATRARVVTVRFDALSIGVLAVQSADKTVEILRMRDDGEVSKKVKRKLKRKREKEASKQGAQTEIANGAAAEGAVVEETDRPVRSFLRRVDSTT